MLYQTQAEINTFYYQVIQKVAASHKVGIMNWDMKSTVELLHEIRQKSGSIHLALIAFLEAYQTWYDVHVEIDIAGKAGTLSSAQNQQLLQAISTRDSTRTFLLSQI